MRSGFFLSRVQWRRGCPRNVGSSWASGQSVNTGVSSLCRGRQRPVVHGFSQMCAPNLCLFGLTACLSVPPPRGIWSQCSRDPVSPLQACFLIPTLPHQVSSVTATPLTP